MKFFDIKAYSGEGVETYLRERLNTGLKDLYAGLRALRFQDNFKSFDWSGIIDAGQTVRVANELKSIPTKRIVVRAIPQAAGTVLIDDSLSAWTTELLYLRNAGTAKAKVIVTFLE